jgi:hypothetical protein
MKMDSKHVRSVRNHHYTFSILAKSAIAYIAGTNQNYSKTHTHIYTLIKIYLMSNSIGTPIKYEPWPPKKA